MADVQSKEYMAGLWETMKTRAQHTAAQIGTGYDNKKLTLDEKLAIWSERALTVEQEWDLWREGKLSPEQIGMTVFPKREQLVKSGGNLEPAAWIDEANYLADEAEKRRATTEQMPRDTMSEQPALPAMPEMPAPMTGLPPESGGY